MDNEAELDRLTGCNLVRRIGGGPTDDALRVISTIDCIADFYVFTNIVLVMYNRLKQRGFETTSNETWHKLFESSSRSNEIQRDLTKNNVQEPHALSKVLYHSDSRKRVLLQKFSRILIDANASHRT